MLDEKKRVEGTKMQNGQPVKMYRFIIPGRGIGLLLPASKLTKEALSFIYEISGGMFEVQEVVVGGNQTEEDSHQQPKSTNTGNAAA